MLSKTSTPHSNVTFIEDVKGHAYRIIACFMVLSFKPVWRVGTLLVVLIAHFLLNFDNPTWLQFNCLREF